MPDANLKPAVQPVEDRSALNIESDALAPRNVLNEVQAQVAENHRRLVSRKKSVIDGIRIATVIQSLAFVGLVVSVPDVIASAANCVLVLCGHVAAFCLISLPVGSIGGAFAHHWFDRSLVPVSVATIVISLVGWMTFIGWIVILVHS